MQQRLRKVVFPVAGLGTRFLPATKVVAKEMLPVLDRPLIQYAVDEAVDATGMKYGGITPIGLPAEWPVLVDRRVAETAVVIVGSGVRRSKILLPGALFERLPGVEIIDGLARPIDG